MDIIIGSSVALLPIVFLSLQKDKIPDADKYILPSIAIFTIVYFVIKSKMVKLFGANIITMLLVGAIAGLIYVLLADYKLQLNENVLHFENKSVMYIGFIVLFAVVYASIYLLSLLNI